MKLTGNQVRGFWASWGGMALDGMDSFLFSMVLDPALRELLPHSGVEATAGNTGYYGGILWALFLIGWGFAFLWGPVADRFGRVRTMIFTILCYSIFTFLCAFAANVWQLAAFRFIAGAGIGGEWVVGGVFVAEEWPEHLRKKGAAWMHSAYYFGMFLAALVNYTIGSHYGWRAVLAMGGTPALLVAFIRIGVVEPKRWHGTRTAYQSFREIFNREFRKRTIVNTALLLCSMIGLWAGSVYVPSSIRSIAAREGLSPAEGARIASYAMMLLASGTIVGCFALPWPAERFGRRITLGMYFTVMFVCISLNFGYLFYHTLWGFVACLFFLGVGGANFSVYTLWLPEQYPTECRGSAFAWATSFGRFIAAGATFLVGAGVSQMHTIGTPVAFTSLAFLAGIALLPHAHETKGKVLPA